MARSTFKVLFYVNGSKEKNGIVPIMGRVTILSNEAKKKYANLMIFGFLLLIL